MNLLRSTILFKLIFICFFAMAQLQKSTVNKSTPSQSLNVFLNKLSVLCNRPNDNELKQLLADNLKNNKSFLKEWEIGLNNKDAQIWQATMRIIKLPYSIDSSKNKITCIIPNIKDANKIPNSLGKLVILPKEELSYDHDIIYDQPSEKGKAIGKVKPGEQYRYFVGTAAYSASLKQYIPDGFEFSGEGDNGYFAIELDAAKHKLGYVSTNATSAYLPVMHLQYLQGIWKIIKLETD